MAKLPILMYHNVCANKTESKGLTISVEKLEQQFRYLVSKGYTSVFFSDMESNKMVPPKKPIIITFDDVYVNQYEFAYPLLKKYNLKACFYAPFSFLGGTDLWNNGTEKLMSVSQLKDLDPSVIELGLHSFAHRPYSSLSVDSIQEDFKKCHNFVSKYKLNISNVLAYPYGNFPRKEPQKTQFFEELKNQNIAYGLRIGNRLNTLPLKNNYELNRLDIKGEDSLFKFRMKLKFGKLSLF